jgi:hypothetical protein
VAHAACLDCHRDPHQGQFAGSPHNDRCESCHAVDGFRPSSFTIARHQKTNFALNGAHTAVVCTECHRGTPPPYRFKERSCESCHRDPHELEGRLSCEACHSLRVWKDLRTYDHDKTRFSLTGSHRAAACGACHRGPERSISFASTPLECTGCHEDAHVGQFSTSRGEGGCARCHRTVSWQATVFDHSKTRFPLDGSHQSVPCRGCHKPVEKSSDRLVLGYAGTPIKCSACHDSR